MSWFTHKRLAIGLAISLALNLFAAGFFVARALRGPGRAGQGADMASPRALFHAARKAGAKQQVRQVMQEHRPELRAKRQAMRDARQAVSRALRAEPFEASALRDALDQVRERTAESQGSVHNAFVQLASELTAAQRHAMADAGGRARGAHRP